MFALNSHFSEVALISILALATIGMPVHGSAAQKKSAGRSITRNAPASGRWSSRDVTEDRVAAYLIGVAHMPATPVAVPVIEDPEFRGIFASMVARAGGPVALKVLETMLADPDPIVRWNVVHGLGMMMSVDNGKRADSILDTLLGMKSDDDDDVRRDLASSLHKSGAIHRDHLPRILPVLEEMKNDRNAYIQILAETYCLDLNRQSSPSGLTP